MILDHKKGICDWDQAYATPEFRQQLMQTGTNIILYLFQQQQNTTRRNIIELFVINYPKEQIKQMLGRANICSKNMKLGFF